MSTFLIKEIAHHMFDYHMVKLKIINSGIQIFLISS